MVVDNLIENVDIVYGIFPGHEEQLYICYYHKTGSSPYLLQYKNNKNEIMFCKSGGLNYPRFQPIRIATLQEREWFLACIKAEKLIPLNKIIIIPKIHEIW